MKPDLHLAVFVYGTLKPGGSAWARLCEGRVARQRPARVRGKLYHLQKTSYPTLVFDAERGGDNWVKGWVLELRDKQVLRDFDEWEDFDPTRPPEKNIYARVRIECFAEDEQNVHPPKSLGVAWVYAMTREQARRHDGVEIPQGEWRGPPASDGQT